MDFSSEKKFFFYMGDFWYTSPTVCLPLPEDGRGNVARAGGVGAAATSVRSPSTAIASACSAPGTVAPQEP